MRAPQGAEPRAKAQCTLVGATNLHPSRVQVADEQTGQSTSSSPSGSPRPRQRLPRARSTGSVRQRAEESDDDSPRTGRVSPCHSLSSSPSRSSLLREPGGAPAPPRSGERQSPTPFQLDHTATPPNVVHVPMSQRSETPIKTFSAVPEFDGKVLFACVPSHSQDDEAKVQQGGPPPYPVGEGEGGERGETQEAMLRQPTSLKRPSPRHSVADSSATTAGTTASTGSGQVLIS